MADLFAPVISKVHAWRASLLFQVLVLAACVFPIWQARYVPLYDYQPHLLEAQVTNHLKDPQLSYAPFYQVRPGWFWRSNALTTLLLVGLGKLLPVDTAGRLVVTGYLCLLAAGFAGLIGALKRPAWLFLFFPILAYNFLFTSGLLNWSYAVALVLFLLRAYLEWERRTTPRLWVFVAGLAFLVYTAHLLAWGAALLAVLTLALGAGLPRRRTFWLGLALSSPLPLLLISRPLLAAAVLAGVVILCAADVLRRRLALTAQLMAPAAVSGALIYLLLIKMLGPALDAFAPGYGYSLYAKLIAIPRTFTLPHFQVPLRPELVVYNLALLGLLALIFGLRAVSAVQSKAGPLFDHPGWLAATGVLLLIYAVIPSRTPDIQVTEPRLLLLAAWFALLGMRVPPVELPAGRMVSRLAAVLCLLSVVMVQVYFIRYDQSAAEWAQALEAIPAGQRLVVLPDPRVLSDEGLYALLQTAQVFEPDAFTSWYAIQKGGFVSTAFFNGPLLAAHPQAVPPYAYSGFRSTRYVQARCDEMRADYDYALVWNPHTEPLLAALRQCYGDPQLLTPLVALYSASGR